VILASDHGFGPTREVFHVNSWLEREGYLAWANGQNGAAERDTQVGFAEVTRHVHALDWERTVAYAATPSSQGINIVSRVPGSDRPLPEESRQTIAAELAKALRAIERPHDGRPLVAEVWTREQAFTGPHAELGPDLSILLTDGGTISILPSETLVARRAEQRGHHRWEGIFMASGPGIREGALVDELSIVDVAPLILHRLGLPVPDDMAGRLPVEIFRPEELERRPLRRSAAQSWTASEPEASDLELDPDEQAAVLRRLRALGYVE
jgi:predicted AlkP superfamily phosphohydrolase/phosphomutase